MKRELSNKEQKIISLISIAVFIIISILIVVFIGVPIIKTARDPEEFRILVDSLGVWGKLIYVFLCFIQVLVAIIPGGPIEVAGGYAFGRMDATILSTIGLGLGSISVFFLSRKLGVKILEVFFKKEKIEELGFLKTNKKRDLIMLLLFLFPGTPKDLLCYYCGLTDMPFWYFFIISTFCRIPAAWFSSAGGSALVEQSYITAVIITACIVLFTLAGIFTYRKIVGKNRKKEEEDNED